MMNFFAQTNSASAYLHEWTSQGGPSEHTDRWYNSLLKQPVHTFDTSLTHRTSTANIFAQRKSVRHYAARPIQTVQLGHILHQVAPSYSSITSGLNPLAAGTHCLLVPLILQRGELAAGAYAYAPEERQLHLINQADPRPIFEQHCFQQEFTSAPIVILIASSLQTSIKGGDRGYRHALIDAGKVMQRLYFAVQTVGLVGSVTGSFIQPKIGHWLEWDGYTTTILAGFALGYAQGETHA